MNAPRPSRDSLATLTLACALAASGCSKDPPDRRAADARQPRQRRRECRQLAHARAGRPGQFPVAAPAPVGTDAYQSELASIKTAQANLTGAQRETIDYWSGGGILRWNQILRELVARYNLPPAPRDDGSYVFPDANNPFADPHSPSPTRRTPRGPTATSRWRSSRR